jgi:hypothetical protein
MGKMHELLAVESMLSANYQRDTQETLRVLDKADNFIRSVASKRHFDEDMKRLDVTETKEMTTTVADRLKWYSGAVRKFLDSQVQKDKTNQIAKADLTVGSTLLAKDVPATTLLMLESKLQDLRKVFEAIPTLPAGKVWDRDEAQNLWRTKDPEVSFSTKKTMKPVILHPATKEHPAQVEKVTEDVPIAKTERVVYSGMLTSAQKADLLSRLDTLLAATKSARQRANATDVVKQEIGNDIFSFLYDGVI